MSKLIIIGRSGSGKDTVANILAKDGMKQLLSVTTRPKRSANENTHVFVSEEEAKQMTSRIAETVINGYQYFATRQQFDECDIYVIDPIGLRSLCNRCPDVDLNVIYIYADQDIRKERAIQRAEDKKKEAEVFEKRTKSEDAQFSEFENAVLNNTVDRNIYSTVKNVEVIINSSNDIEILKDNVKRTIDRIVTSGSEAKLSK